MSDAKSKPYDIFRMGASGLLWLEAATSIDDAKTRAQQLATHSPGEYLLFNQATGVKHVVKADGTCVPHQEQAEASAPLAIRTLLRAVGMKLKRRYTLEILE